MPIFSPLSYVPLDLWARGALFARDDRSRTVLHFFPVTVVFSSRPDTGPAGPSGPWPPTAELVPAARLRPLPTSAAVCSSSRSCLPSPLPVSAGVRVDLCAARPGRMLSCGPHRPSRCVGPGHAACRAWRCVVLALPPEPPVLFLPPPCFLMTLFSLL